MVTRICGLMWRGPITVTALLLASLTACGGSGKDASNTGPGPTQGPGTNNQLGLAGRSDPSVILVDPAATPLADASEPVRIGAGATIGIVVAIDEAVARHLALAPENYRNIAYPVSDALDERRGRREDAPFTILAGPVRNDGRNVLVTVSLRANRGAEPYRLTLSAQQGSRRWSRSLVRGQGAERPGHERILSGEEGPWMTLNQRLGTSLRPDVRDLAGQLVRHISWEIAGDQRND